MSKRRGGPSGIPRGGARPTPKASRKGKEVLPTGKEVAAGVPPLAAPTAVPPAVGPSSAGPSTAAPPAAAPVASSPVPPAVPVAVAAEPTPAARQMQVRHRVRHQGTRATG